MKQLLNPDTSSNVTEFNQPVVVSGFPVGSVIDEIRVSSLRTDDMPYLVRVDSPGITIKRIIASCPLDLERDGKAKWMQTVASGVLVMGDDVTIGDVQAENVHTVVTLRGKNGKVLSGSACKFSGDGIQEVNDGCEAKMQFAGSLEVYPYEAFHRDIAQLWKYGGGILRDCKVSVTYLHESIANFPPQGVVGFDGEYENITVHDCRLFGVHQVHGVSFGCSRNTAVKNVHTDSLIRFGGHKGEPSGSNNCVIDCKAKDIVFEDGSQAKAHPVKPKEQVHDMDQVAWLAGLRNTNAPAITEEDYVAAATRMNCEVAAIKAVFQVEAASSGYNRDGSLKSLYERHIGRREVIGHKLPLKAIAGAVGSALISRFTGGYKGGIAEYWRIGQVVRAIAAVSNEPDPSSPEFPPDSISLEVALRSASWGRPQILGKNCELAGYATAREMVEAMHKSEKAHLDAFVSFVENTGLDKHLRNKDWLAFAKGYNGKRCCDRGAKKNYAAEIAAAYRQISGQPVEFKPMSQSRMVQGSVAGAATGATGIAAVVTELQGQVTGALDKLQEVKDQAAGIKAQADSALMQAGELKAQVTDIVASNADLLNIVGDMKWWLYALAGVLAVSLIGNAYALYARWDDRRNGYK